LNAADLLAKPLAVGKKRAAFVRMIVHLLFGAMDYSAMAEPLLMDRF
jgi:hypothetical protein